MKTKKYFPMYVDLSDKPIVVVGGGTIGTRRASTLCEFSDKVCVIAPQVSGTLEELASLHRLSIVKREYHTEDLLYAFMVIAATDDHRVNEQIYDFCRKQGIYVNTVHDKSKCDFYFPGIVQKDEMVIGINASGMNHKKAKDIRVGIEEYLNQRES